MSKQEIVNKEIVQAPAIPVLSPQMQAFLEEQQAGSKQRLKYISTAAGTFTYEKQPIPNNALAVIILDYINENVLYRKKYNPDDPSPPNCFAFGRGKALMRPHDEAIEKVAENCGSCNLAKFGSAKEIEWKKSAMGCGCNMKRRLAIISVGEVLKDGKVKLNSDQIELSEICFLTVPVTSATIFDGYSSHITKVRKPNVPLSLVATKIGLVPDPKTMWKMTFHEIKMGVDMYGAEHPVSLLDEVSMAKIEARQEEARALIETPYSNFINDSDDGVIDRRTEKF